MIISENACEQNYGYYEYISLYAMYIYIYFGKYDENQNQCMYKYIYTRRYIYIYRGEQYICTVLRWLSSYLPIVSSLCSMIYLYSCIFKLNCASGFSFGNYSSYSVLHVGAVVCKLDFQSRDTWFALKNMSGFLLPCY